MQRAMAMLVFGRSINRAPQSRCWIRLCIHGFLLQKVVPRARTSSPYARVDRSDELAAASRAPGVQLERTLSRRCSAMKRGEFARPATAQPQFDGDRVRTRNLNPATHTRLPRYARDKSVRLRRIGLPRLSDTAAIDAGETAVALYRHVRGVGTMGR